MNNPFGRKPQSIVDQAAERFPSVPSEPSAYAAPHFQQPQYTGYEQQQQQSYTQQPNYPQPQLYPQPQFPQSTGFGQSGVGPVPAQFGQQNAYAGIHAGHGGQQSSYGGGGGWVSTADLDPYASLGNFSSQPSSSNTPSSIGILQVQQLQSHPRQFVQENKQSLMSWDDYSWKQLFVRVDALREAWEQRVAGIKAAANQGADPTSVDQMTRDAESHVDSIHAAKMQMNEVKSGWKHSTDPASKARVREALNAGLSAMPEYPSPIDPAQLGGSFQRNAAQQYQKSAILSQYGGGGGGGGWGGALQSQQTGYGSSGYPQAGMYGQQQYYQ